MSDLIAYAVELRASRLAAPVWVVAVASLAQVACEDRVQPLSGGAATELVARRFAPLPEGATDVTASRRTGIELDVLVVEFQAGRAEADAWQASIPCRFADTIVEALVPEGGSPRTLAPRAPMGGLWRVRTCAPCNDPAGPHWRVGVSLAPGPAWVFARYD